MKLTPHVVLETTWKLRDQRWLFPETFREALPGFARLLRQAVMFDFGEQTHSDEHVHFALDLYERGLFALPFPVTAFSVIRKSGSPGHEGQDLPGLILLSMGDPDGPGLTCTVCSPTQDRFGRVDGGIPATMGFQGRVKDFDGETAQVDLQVHPVITQTAMNRMFGSYDVMHKRVSQALLNAMGMTVMLMSRGVETIHHPAPDKLNRARAKKGRPPIGESYSVRIAAEHVRRIALEDGTETDITGHTRKSPRPHWRRGHFRTLPSGSVVPGAPALIGTNDNALARPVYELARSAGEAR